MAQNSQKYTKNDVFGHLKKIESKDLAENGLKRCLLLLYNLSPKSHIWQKGVKRGKRGICAQNSPKNGKLSKTVEKIWKNHKKSQKDKNKLKKYFWSKWRRSKGVKGVKTVQKMENYQKGSKKYEKITKNHKK